MLSAPEIFGAAGNVEGLHMTRRLHKAGHKELAGTTLWWKACPSNREDSVLLGNGHNLALAYVGACPFMPDSYEIVLICEDRTAAAVLEVLPSLLCDSEQQDPRVFGSPPAVSCLAAFGRTIP